MMFGLKEEHIAAIHQCFTHYPAIEKIIIYGSRATENYRYNSDIDLVIIDQNMSYPDLLKLENEIDDLMLPYKMDLSLKRNIRNSDLLTHIERAGKTFYERVEQIVLNEPPLEYGNKETDN